MVQIIKALLNKFFNAFMWALLQKLSENLGTTANTIAAMVNDLEAQKLTGSQKAHKLSEQIKILAITKGKEVAQSDINFAIETALKAVRTK